MPGINSHQDDSAEVRIPRTSTGNWGAPRPANPPVAAKVGAAPLVRGGYGTPNVRDWYFFAVEMQTALSAGVPFVDALRLVGTTSARRSIRTSSQFLLQRMQSGNSATQAINDAGDVPPLIRNLLVAGMRSGNLPTVMRQITEHYGWLLEIRGRILRAIAYPTFLLVAGTLIMIIRDVVIDTQTKGVSTSAAVISNSLYYLIPVLTAAAAAVIIAWAIFTPLAKPHFDRVILTAPVIGKMVKSYTLTVFYRVFSLLLGSGMPITNAWILAQKSAPNHYIGSHLQTGLRFLQDGETLEEALKQSKAADAGGKAMAAVGESVGTASTLLQRYATWQEDELKNKSRMLISLIGLPCIVLVGLGYFVSPVFLAVLAFLIVLARRLV